MTIVFFHSQTSQSLTTAQALSIIVPIIGMIISSIFYLFQYGKGEYAEIAKMGESERWDAVKEEYGNLVSTTISDINDSANLFIGDLDNPNERPELLDEVITGWDEFRRLHKLMKEMEKPKRYNRYCRRGAQMGPVAFVLAIIFAFGFIFTETTLSLLLFILTIVASVSGIGLFLVFIFYRARMNSLEDEIQFRT